MSLIKQLWLGIIVILLLALGGSFVISMISAKSYMEEQLQLKNIDNATSLALSMTQMEKDPVTLELLIAAQFDSGHYQRITLVDPNHKVLVERQFNHLHADDTAGFPQWFTRIISLNAAPGIAQVQDGWQQYGTLTVESHSRFAWQALWHGTVKLLQWFLFAALCSGLVGTFILKYISRPLDIVVQQAEAIGQQRFVISAEPKTTEFQRLVRAMNSLSSNVKNLLEKETRQLELLQRESQQDPLTGLSNRAHFLNLLESKLTREDADNHGVLVMVRVLDLVTLNHQIGHIEVDNALRQIAAVLHQCHEHYSHSHVGRLNGSDFALVVPGSIDAERLARELAQQLSTQLNEQGLQTLGLPLAACVYTTGEKRAELMNKLDGALAQAELKGNRAVIALAPDVISQHRNLNEWRTAILQALAEDKLELASYPVKEADGNIVHFEAPGRLWLDGHLQPAGYFVHWATRLGLIPRIDLEVVKTALHQLTHMQLPLAINMSADSLCNAECRTQVITLLQAAPLEAKDLWFDFHETCALRHMAEFRSFTAQLRSLGCRVGLEHVGPEFTQIRELQDIGLHYLKVDSAIVRGIDSNTGNQHFLHNLCKIGHSLGFSMIAEGVQTDEEKQTLFKVGIDAVTGPGV